jgi:membrane dipeptidase
LPWSNIPHRRTAFVGYVLAALLAGPAKLAADADIERAALVSIDVPAASGALEAAGPSVFENAGVELDLVMIPPETPDMTPNIAAAVEDGRARFVLNADDLETCRKGGSFGAILHYEGAEAIDPEFVVLRLAYALGLRSLGLAWSRSNIFAEGVGDNDRGRGLTYLGTELVRRCNDLGVLVDVSHLNVAGFWDVVETTSKPIVASHSNARAVCDHERNLHDDQIKALAENGGLMGINFARQFIVEGAKTGEDVPLSAMVDHIDHIVNLAGIDHVALGSDYDGASMPAELYDAAQTPKLIEAMRERGYDEEAIRKFGRDNWVRVLSEVWE